MKSTDAIKAQGKSKKRGEAHRGLALIRKLYRIERQVRKLEPGERYARRQKRSRPILDEIRKWLNGALPQVAPSSATGMALNYLNNEWDELTRYLDDVVF